MRILLLRTWLSNIGNGFIDMGARSILERSAPDATVHEVSGYPNYAADRMSSGQLAGVRDAFGRPRELLKDALRERRNARERVVNVADYVDADVAVLPGCTLYKHALVKYEPVLRSLSERGTKIVFLGAGGGDYTDETRRYVSDVLDEIDAVALLTRDENAYDCYGSALEFSYSGIDCAFFIDEWYSPPESNGDFSVATFDKRAEPSGLPRPRSDVIRPDHTPFGYALPFDGVAPALLERYKFSKRGTKAGQFVSDSLRDYLFWYGNADVTHSDRIHACVPTLAYGNRAQFHYETPRAALFDRLPLDGITEEPVSMERSALEREKRAQVKATKQALDLASS